MTSTGNPAAASAAVPASDAASGAVPASGAPAERVDRADRIADRWSGPVLLAALASIPATFLTVLDGAYATAGTVLHWMSGAVLVAETVVLFALAEDRRRWLRRHRWLVGLTALLVPAVLFAVGPVQLLRLLRIVGGLRILRVRRILRAGRIIRRRHQLGHRWERVLASGLTFVAAAFVAVTLADPTSRSRQVVQDLLGVPVSVAAVLVAGLVLAVATYVVRSDRGRDQASDGAGPR